jgi:hypothetical protein
MSLDLTKPFKGSGFLGRRRGAEWSSVDLQSGTPLGDLVDALIELLRVFPHDIFPQLDPGRPGLDNQSLLDDYAKAQQRWPEVKTKPLCRLMCAHFSEYRKVKPDALYKRVRKELEHEAAVLRMARVVLPKPPPPRERSLGDAIRVFTWCAHVLAEDVEARKTKKVPIPPPIAELFREAQGKN